MTLTILIPALTPTVLDVSSWAANAVGGSMVLALPVAMLAGLVSFFSPCVVPLLPGYLSYATGMSAAEVVGGTARRGRMLIGSILFVLGFTAVFIATGVLVGSLGSLVGAYQSVITRVVGVLAILMGLIFAGLLPLGRREFRLKRMPAVGIAGAPLLGVVFGLGWTPCMGPTLAVIYGLSLNEGSGARAGILAFVFSLGLGIPFVVAGLAFTKMARAVTFLRKHQVALMRFGGLLMVVVGVLLVSGLWESVVAEMRQWVAGFVPVI